MIAKDAHLRCTLGNWLETRARELDLDEATYGEILDIHKTVHDLGREMAISARAGVPIAEDVYDSFLASSESLVGLIETAYDEIIASINATDPLTGAENRSIMDKRLKEQIAGSQPSGSRNWLMMVDLDRFKSVNDRFGHELGDAVLRGFASAVRDHIRSKDLFFRYGGEEFVLCISKVDESKVAQIAERLRTAIAQRVVLSPAGEKVSVTASFGVTALTPGMTVTEAINAADQAMYAAKHAGRNRVVFHPTG